VTNLYHADSAQREVVIERLSSELAPRTDVKFALAYRARQ
jgi:hypothetical protein